MTFDNISYVQMTGREYKKVDSKGSILSKGRNWTSYPMVFQERPDFSLMLSISVEEHDGIISSLMPKKMRASLKLAPKDATRPGVSFMQHLNLTDSSQVFGRLKMENGHWATEIYHGPMQLNLKREMEGILGEDFPYSTAMLEMLERARYSGGSETEHALFDKDMEHAIIRLDRYVINGTEGVPVLTHYPMKKAANF